MLVRIILVVLLLATVIGLLIATNKGPFIIALPVLVLLAHFYPIPAAEQEKARLSAKTPLSWFSAPIFYFFLAVPFLWALFHHIVSA